MKIAAVIQARMGSTRLPGKVLLQAGGKTVLRHVVDRTLKCATVPTVIVATTVLDEDQAVVDEVLRVGGVQVFRGEVNDVLDRYYQCALQFGIEVIVRLTADCPVLDSRIVDQVVAVFHNGQMLDYAATGRSFPEGYGVEVIRFEALRSAWLNARAASEREHVTAYLWNRPQEFKVCKVEHTEDLSGYRLTLDNDRDWALLSRLIPDLSRMDPYFGIDQVADYLRKNPDLARINQGIAYQASYHEAVRNEQKNRA